jgi:hypothetical protein
MITTRAVPAFLPAHHRRVARTRPAKRRCRSSGVSPARSRGQCPGRQDLRRPSGPLASDLARPSGGTKYKGAVCGCAARPASTADRGWRWVAMSGTRTEVLSQPRGERGVAQQPAGLAGPLAGDRVGAWDRGHGGGPGRGHRAPEGGPGHGRGGGGGRAGDGPGPAHLGGRHTGPRDAGLVAAAPAAARR